MPFRSAQEVAWTVLVALASLSKIRKTKGQSDPQRTFPGAGQLFRPRINTRKDE